MSILIGGGSGFIGTRLTNYLVRLGHEVIYVSRRAGQGRITWQELQYNGLPSGCTAVVNLAGENLMNPMKRWGEDFKNELYSSRIDTTQCLAKVISEAENKPNVFISSSACGYYEPHPTQEYTEESEGGNYDFLSKMTRDWEAAAKLPVDVNVRQVVLRIGVVLGREGGVIQSMFMPFYLGAGGPVASGKQWFPWIHINDVVGIIDHAIMNEHVSGVLNAVAPEPTTNAQFTSAFAKALWRPAFIPVPEFMVNLVFGKERGSVITKGPKILPKHTLESGYKFLYPDITSACKEFAHLIPSGEGFKWHSF